MATYSPPAGSTAIRDLAPEDGARVQGSRPVMFWAGLGAIFIAFGVYLFASWIISGDAKPVPQGPDDVPGYMSTSIRVWEAFIVLSMVIMAYTRVYKPLRKGGRLPFDTLLFLGFLTLIWQDVLMNFGQFTFQYNSEFVNVGSWYSHIPGWISPNGHLYGEPLLGIFFLYAPFFFIGAVIVCWFLGVLKKYRPQMRAVPAFLICMVVICFLDFLFEAMFQLRLGFYVWPNAIEELTIFHGKYYQWPIYEGILAGVLCTSFGYLRYYRNDRGESYAERGLDQIKVSARKRGIIRFVAIAGALNVIYLTTYMIPWIFMGMNGDPVPKDIQKRSYLLTGQCGPGTDYACPSPDVPIPRPNSLHLSPSGELVRP